ncbi:MAG: hypothetical protein LBB48_04390, partial [Treponema sp.]|nr:hypothetical protein [Treponema sp.]
MKSMKTMMRIAALAAALGLAVPNAAFAKDRLAILPFTGGQGEDGETIAELFSFEKDLTAAFTPVPRTSINSAIRSEQGFQMESGMTDPDTIASLGKQLGAQYVVAGSITALGTQKLLIIAIIKIDELRQVAGDIQTYGAISEIRGKLPAMAKSIVDASRKDTSELPRLAVPPVRLSGGADTRDADTLAQILAVHLVRSGKYAVYPRTKSLEQVQTEYGNQFGGDVADEYLPKAGTGNNPRLVLSVTARKLDGDTMFNAAVINLETGIQEVGDTVDYQSLEDGMRIMEELALKLSGQGEKAAQIKADAAMRNAVASSAASFAWAVAAVNNDKAGGVYTITLKGGFSADPVVFTANAVKTITLKGEGAARAITNNGNEALFTVPKGISLVLESGVTLDGNDKKASVVVVQGGAFVMKTGGTVRGAKGGTTLTADGYECGGGVFVDGGGAFTIEGGTITGNTASYRGGGVYVRNGAFAMQGGIITGNTASSGGGVYVLEDGVFTLKDGTITGNTASSDDDPGYGGGVSVGYDGAFTMQGGEESRNTASTTGGGVNVQYGAFTLEGGTVTGNPASSGGGVWVDNGEFMIEGGT